MGERSPRSRRLTMKRTRYFFEIVVSLVFIGALALGAVVAFRAGRGGGPAGSAAKTPQGYPPPEATVPAPAPTLPPQPTLPLVLPGETLVIPTLTPWPTLTPQPTPTRRPGPTATALPLPTPASDASGLIYFTTVGEAPLGSSHFVLP